MVALLTAAPKSPKRSRPHFARRFPLRLRLASTKKEYVTPKERTRFPRMQERGSRYYHPDEGRWISRDPSGAADEDNAYLMCGNACEGRIDAFGLWKTPVIQKGTGYGTICADKDGDPPEDLVQKLKTIHVYLDPTEWKKWLRDSAGKPIQGSIKKGWYRFPATVLFTYGWIGNTGLKENIGIGLKSLKDVYTGGGYLMKDTYIERYTFQSAKVGAPIFFAAGSLRGEIQSSFDTTPYIAVWVHAGHGGSKKQTGWQSFWGMTPALSGGILIIKGTIAPSGNVIGSPGPTFPGGPPALDLEGGPAGLFAKDFSFNYKFSQVYMYACGAGLGDWKKTVAPGGKLHAATLAVTVDPNYTIPALDLPQTTVTSP